MSSCKPGPGGAGGPFWPSPPADERGVGLVEYVLVLSLLALVSLAALTFMGGSIRNIFVAIGERIFAG